MDILFVTPYPPSRIRSRAFGFVTHLAEVHTVTILTQVASPQEWSDVQILRDQGFEVVPVAHGRRSALIHSGIALLGQEPVQVAHARSLEFLKTALHLCESRSFDIIHVEHLRGIASVERLAQKYPLVWDAVDCISDLWRQTAQSGPNLATRLLARLEYKRTENYEIAMQEKLAHILTISASDRQALLKLIPSLERTAHHSTITVIPNGVDLHYFAPTREEMRPHNIVFSGKMSYHANVAAAHYLYQRIMPLIWKECPEATLTIVGSKPPRSIQKFASDQRVEVTGYVEDMRPYIGRAHAMISPMVYSVGLQNKVLEAMALGTPTVISTQSARALAARPGRDLSIASTPQEYAQHILALFNNAQARADMSSHGRSYVEEHHNWRQVTASLTNLYRQVITLSEREARVSVRGKATQRSVYQ